MHCQYEVALGTLSQGIISGQSFGVVELGRWEGHKLLGQIGSCQMRVLTSFCEMMPSDQSEVMHISATCVMQSGLRVWDAESW